MQLDQLIRLACLWEATIPKPGNVHPQASFDDLTYDDFVMSAEAIAPKLGTSEDKRVGELVLDAAQATMKAVGKNTNLGIILILAPLAVARREAKPISTILEQLGVQDAIDVYQAIRVMQPGGMGKVPEQDVSDIPTITLLDAMRMAVGRDLIARQYAHGYHNVQQLLLPHLKKQYMHFSMDHECVNVHASLVLSVQSTFLTGIAEMGESLIRRKCGESVEKQAQLYARQILQAGWPRTEHAMDLFYQFDIWLRADSHRRNPGTMADLMAATLFLALAEGVIPPIAP